MRDCSAIFGGIKYVGPQRDGHLSCCYILAFNSKKERAETLKGLCIDVGAGIHQVLQVVGVSLGCRKHQRGLAMFIAGVDICAQTGHFFQNPAVSRTRTQMECSGAIFHRITGICPGCQ